MSSESDFKEVVFREEDETEGGVGEDHTTGDLGSPSKKTAGSTTSIHHQTIVTTHHNNPSPSSHFVNPFSRRPPLPNHFYGRHHSLTPPADDEEEDDDDDTSEEIFGVPSRITPGQDRGNFPGQRQQTTKNLIANPFKTDSPVLDHHQVNHNHSSETTKMSKSYAIDPKGTGLSVRSSLAEPNSVVADGDEEQSTPASITPITTAPSSSIIHTVSHPQPSAMIRSPSMPERRAGGAVGGGTDHHHHHHPTLTRGHSLSTSASTSNLSSAVSHPLVQVIKDTVYSSFLYNKQRVQEKLLPLLPFPSSGGSGSTGGKSGTSPTPFLLKSSDPVLEARVLALKNARYQIKQILHVTGGPVISSLNQLSTAFSQLNLLINELNSPRVDFSSSGGSQFSHELPISSVSYVGRGGTARGAACPETDQQLRELTGTLRALSLEAEKMKAGIEFLNANMDTLVKKTMADTLGTCSQLEVSRVEYDAERNYLLSLQASSTPVATPTGKKPPPTTITHDPESPEEKCRQRVNQLEQKYHALKSDVAIKLDFLYANRDKVLNKSLSMFHSLLGSFFHPLPVTSGARTKLDSVLKAYSVKNPITSPTSSSSADIASSSKAAINAPLPNNHSS